MDAINYTTYFWMHDTSQTGGDFTINIYRSSGSVDQQVITVYYSTDQTNWELFGTIAFNSTFSKSFPYGSKVYLKATTDYWGKFVGDNAIMHQITANKYHSIGGNIMSLIYGDNFVGKKTFPDDSIKGIFLRLFYGNTYLTDARELVLPVTHSTSPVPTELDNMHNLASCYSRMFMNCTHLVNGPVNELRARGEFDLWHCNNFMYQNCTSLGFVGFNTQDGNGRYVSVLSGANANAHINNYSGTTIDTTVGTQKHIVSMYLPTYDRVKHWDSNISGRVESVDDNNNVRIYRDYEDTYNPLYVENTYAGSNTITLTTQSASSPVSGQYATQLQYSKDKTNWTTVNLSTSTPVTITMLEGEKVYFRNNSGYFNYFDRNSNAFWTTINCSASYNVAGNASSLLDYNNMATAPLSFGCFAKLFYGDPNLQYADRMTFTEQKVVPERAFYDIFHDCTGLVAVCDFNSVEDCTNGWGAFNSMLQGCTSLINAPNFRNLKNTGERSCFSWYAHDCTALKTAGSYDNLTTVGPYGFNQSFFGCTSLVTSAYTPKLTGTISEYGFNRTYYGCSKLVTSHDFRNITSVGTNAFGQAFYGCSSLKYIVAPTLSSWSTTIFTQWLRNVSSSGTFYFYGTASVSSGYSGRPTGWTLITT